MQITVIMNGEPEEVERLRGEIERLRQEGHEVSPRLTFEAGDAWRFGREAAEAGAEVVVAAGGDGTVNEVANGIHEALGSGVESSPRLAIVPLGTANDLAGALEVPGEIGRAMEVALLGRAREVDVALAGERCFLNVSTGGLGAEATEEAPEEVKRAVGALAYLVTGVRKFVELRTSEARFTAGDELLHEGPFLFYAVGNSVRTGGGNWLTPRADLADGLLDVCVVGEISRVDFARLLPELRRGGHLDHPAVLYRQVPAVTVESGEELSVNVDGEPLAGVRRLEYRLSPRRLLLVGP